MVTLINDRDPIDEVENFDVVMLGTTIYGEMQYGFQKRIALKYPYVEQENRVQPYGDLRRLGTRLTFNVKGDPIITLLYICAKVGKKKYSLHKDKFIHALQTANKEFKGMNVLTTAIGTMKWEGGLTFEESRLIIEENTPELNIYLFTKEQKELIW